MSSFFGSPPRRSAARQSVLNLRSQQSVSRMQAGSRIAGRYSCERRLSDGGPHAVKAIKDASLLISIMMKRK